MDSFDQAACTTEPALILHSLPGRIRYRLRGLRSRPEVELRLLDALGGYPGISEIQVSARTGTVLVEYDQRLNPEEMSGLLAAAIRGDVTPHPRAARPAAAGKSEESGGLRHWLGKLVRRSGGDVSAESAPAGTSIELAEQDWHALPGEEVLRRLHTGSDGLNTEEIARRLQQLGRNVLPTKPPRSLFALFVDQLNSVPVMLLLGSSVLSLLTGGLVDAAVIFAVVMINASLGCATERHAEDTIRTLTQLDEPETLLRRNGRALRMDASEVVPGDILLLSRGAYIPADARILEARGLTVAESALTGESAPILKQTGMQPAQLSLADRRNMVYRGTVVTGGSGIAVTVATGMKTEIGKIHALVSEAFRPETPMERQLDDLGRQTAYAATGICLLTLVFGWLRGFGVLESLRSAVSLAVAALPEGLPTMSTTALAFGMRRMRQHNVLARNLSAVETIGAINVLCLDKTGTLTANRMSVVEVFADGKRLGAELMHALFRESTGNTASAHLEMLLATCALCSEAEVLPGSFPEEFAGSATEVALLDLVSSARATVSQLRARFKLLELHARTEERNFMITVHEAPGGRRLLAMKGSPAEVLLRCRQWAGGSRKKMLSPKLRQGILAENERLASQARRVLGFAFLEIDADQPTPEQGFVWLGLIGLADPPREGVGEALRALHRAGIETRMITGDQRATALATANEIGLGEPGEELDVFDASEMGGSLSLTGKAVHSKVFSRVSPSQKLEIVQALQREGLVVGMTGDGINDGPALKASDVGIALGRQSTETARESADLILRNDDLRSLLAAVREGRAIHNNIRQAVRFLITTNVSEVFSVLGSVAVGFGQPLTPRQLLWLNLVTDIFPVLALAVEPAHAGTLSTPPPDSRLPLLSREEFPLLFSESGLMAGAVAISYGYALRRYGSGNKATTLAFFSLSTAQLLHTLTTQSRQHAAPGAAGPVRNKYVPLAVCGGMLLELITMLPPFRSLLGLSSLDLLDAGVCAGSVAASSLATMVLRFFMDSPTAPSRPSPSLSSGGGASRLLP